MGQPKLTNILPVNKTNPIKTCIEHSKKKSDIVDYCINVNCDRFGKIKISIVNWQ
jgi:hypothetical protein